MKRARDSWQNVAILAILRLPRSCKSVSFPATTAPRSTIPCTNIPQCI